MSGSMDRRDFIKVGSLGAAAAATVGTAACAPSDAAQDGANAEPWWTTQAFELEEATIAELSADMAEGRRSSAEITQLYLDRIAALDRQGPQLRSIIETNPDAIRIAAELDAERAAGNIRGPLHGIPIVVKDNVDTADGMTTTAGSYALEGHVASRDSHVAAQLRAAGAIILAKANLSEWANFRSTRSSSGWSGRGGQCGNAYAVDRNPCGSSAGSGAAASANFCAGSIGTETNGSIVCPSSVNGVVGLKPTVGLVSRAGIIPIAHTQDTAGPMTRTVADAAAMLTALAGPDPRDPMSAPAAQYAGTDYTTFLDANALQGARIGIERSYFGADPNRDGLMEAAIVAMANAGATIIDNANLVNRRLISEPSYQVLLYEFKADLEIYFQSVAPELGMRTLDDLIAFNESNLGREMPWFGQEIVIEANEKGDLSSREYLEAKETARRYSQEEGIDALMEEHQLDAIVAPTTRSAWKTDLINGGLSSLGSSSNAAVAGYPSITVPMGFVHGLPIGMLFFGRAWDEAGLIRLAYSYEQATHHRRPARMLPTLDLRNL
jgi:amidase